MDDAGIRRRLDAIIALQLLLLALALPGGSAVALLFGALFVLYAVFRGLLLMERQPGQD